MQFRERLSDDEISKYEHVSKYANVVKEWYWVTVEEEDLKHKIHIHVYAKENGQPYKFQTFSEKSCLGEYAKLLVNNDFKFDKLQIDFDKIKGIAMQFNYDKCIESPLVYLSKDTAGPYMIVDSMHRQLAIYIHHFIWKNSDFKSFENAICGISQIETGDLTRIPKNFC